MRWCVSLRRNTRSPHHRNKEERMLISPRCNLSFHENHVCAVIVTRQTGCFRVVFTGSPGYCRSNSVLPVIWNTYTSNIVYSTLPVYLHCFNWFYIEKKWSFSETSTFILLLCTYFVCKKKVRCYIKLNITLNLKCNFVFSTLYRLHYIDFHCKIAWFYMKMFIFYTNVEWRFSNNFTIFFKLMKNIVFKVSSLKYT